MRLETIGLLSATKGDESMTRQLQRVLRTFEEQFDASLARQEEEAADDLAISLHQERSLASALIGAGEASLWLPGGGSIALSVVGSDYGGSGIPLSAIWRAERVTVQVRAEGSPPAPRRDTFLEVVRLWAREVRQVEVAVPGDSFTGRLTRTGRDHLVVTSSNGRRIIPLELVTSVKLVRGD